MKRNWSAQPLNLGPELETGAFRKAGNGLYNKSVEHLGAQRNSLPALGPGLEGKKKGNSVAAYRLYGIHDKTSQVTSDAPDRWAPKPIIKKQCIKQGRDKGYI